MRAGGQTDGHTDGRTDKQLNRRLVTRSTGEHDKNKSHFWQSSQDTQAEPVRRCCGSCISAARSKSNERQRGARLHVEALRPMPGQRSNGTMCRARALTYRWPPGSVSVSASSWKPPRESGTQHSKCNRNGKKVNNNTRSACASFRRTKASATGGGGERGNHEMRCQANSAWDVHWENSWLQYS